MLNINIKNKKKTIIKLCVLSILILLFTFIIFLFKSNYINYNFSKTGHNMSNKKLEEIEEYILNISSYTATVDITVTSNKTTNKYKIKQEYNKDRLKQTIIEPKNIEGLEICYENNTLKLTNTKLNLTKIYEEYNYLSNNYLDLITFIEEYKKIKNVKENKIDTDIKDTINSYEKDGKYIFEIEFDKNIKKKMKIYMYQIRV
jgi:outer membrane lipoprotein-sorting protein